LALGDSAGQRYRVLNTVNGKRLRRNACMQG